MIRILLPALAGLFVMAGFAIAQTPAQFEVVSVKPHPAGDNDGGIGPHPGGFAATGMPLKILIQVAYRVKGYQISGGPGWIDAERYDILAKAAEGVNPSHEQLMPMLQAMLADRFRLKIHRETRELPAFALVVAKGGARLIPTGSKPAGADNSDEFFRMMPGGSISMSRGMLKAKGITVAGLADALGIESDRALVDRTGLTGEFDVTLKWNPEVGDQDASGASLFTAIQEQLGLKLEATKAPVEVLVIDSAEKPSPN